MSGRTDQHRDMRGDPRVGAKVSRLPSVWKSAAFGWRFVNSHLDLRNSKRLGGYSVPTTMCSSHGLLCIPIQGLCSPKIVGGSWAGRRLPMH